EPQRLVDAAARQQEASQRREGARIAESLVDGRAQVALGGLEQAEPRLDEAQALVTERALRVAAGQFVEERELRGEVALLAQYAHLEAQTVEVVVVDPHADGGLVQGLVVDPSLLPRLCEQPVDQLLALEVVPTRLGH